MSRNLIVLDEAETELAEAATWYETQRAGLGREFLSAIEEALGRLMETPSIAISPPGVSASLGARSVFVKRFPYSIVFVEHDGDLWVVAFAHQRRRPGYWRRRASGVGS